MRISKAIGLLLLLISIPLTGLRCTKGVSREVAEASKPVTLKWWRVFDDEQSVRPIIEAYKALHPNVNIEYRKIRYDEYENTLLDALAEDRGPDIISLHNTGLGKYQNKIAFLPPTLTIPFQEVRGSLKKEVVTTLKTSPTISISALKQRFVDAVVNDVLITTRDDKNQPKEQIIGLPLALDTLVLYSNRDLLNMAGVPEPPKTWQEFQQAVIKLTKLDQQGNIIQAGAALGTSRNTERAADILALLMMQNGAEMMDAGGRATFHRAPALSGSRSEPPGEQALLFYTDFANPQKEVYTWSAEQPLSLEAFISGRATMLFGYAYHLPIIRARAPRMNLVISKTPQIEGMPEVNLANYWVETVSRKSKYQNWAWNFIQFAAGAEQAAKYLEKTSKPAALRALLPGQWEKEDAGIFAAQALTSKSWYRGTNPRGAEEALLDAIDAALTGAEVRDILNVAAQRINNR